MSYTIELDKYSLECELKEAIKEDLYFTFSEDLNVDLNDQYHEALSNTIANMTIYSGTCKEIVFQTTGYDMFDEWDNHGVIPTDIYAAASNALHFIANENLNLEDIIEELKQENIK